VGLGGRRLTDRHAAADPPTRRELAAMADEARAALASAPDAAPGDIVAVGGTVSNLLKVLPEARADGILSRARIARALEILAAEPAADASARHGVNLVRAVIVDAILERYRADWLRVSEAGIREGAILAAQHAGPNWRDRLADLAHGWRS
jgi:exopolyphosphatase/pppGpp-phosphohydrolase